jgi:hypothetical protein
MVERLLSDFVQYLAVAPLPAVFGLGILYWHISMKRFSTTIADFRKQFNFEQSNSPQKFVEMNIKKIT